MSDSTAPARKRWPRMAGEGLVIVLSILLAFGIDAGWQAKQERSREREYIEALREEMQLAAAELAEDYRRRALWVTLADSILSEAASRTRPDTVVNVWIQQASMGMARFFPPSSVLDDLVSSGNLAVLSSTALRFALLSYQRGRERVNFIGDWGRTAVEDGLRPYLTEHFRWSDARLLPIPADGRLPPSLFRPVPVPAGTIQGMLDDPVFENLVLIRQHRLGLVQRRSAQLTEMIDDVIKLLDAEAVRLGA